MRKFYSTYYYFEDVASGHIMQPGERLLGDSKFDIINYKYDNNA